MQDSLLNIAAGIIAKASREHPADAMLRAELRGRKEFSAGDRRAISHAVFAYYRWFGWLDQPRSLDLQIRQAMELDESFLRKPESFSDEDLIARAVPGWVKEVMRVTPGWVRSLQTAPALWLRARPGQGRALAKKLGECWIPGAESLADAVRYDGPEDLFRAPEFHAGEFEVQDINSQMVGLACNPQPGETWWDACAGEGGKLLHLCDLMRNKGLVWASDRVEWRLKKLKRRAARARLFNYRAISWSGGAKLPTKTKFDGILVDAPCSGIGTWQRNPHARWTTTPEDVEELSELQKQLLTNVVPALKSGGRLIYSACTLSRAETVEIAEAITNHQFQGLKPATLAHPANPARIETGQLWLTPEEFGGNGMFVAGWVKAQ
jgi:16S rRNA (cytosine967-C5)-methyltransferase